LRSSVVVFMMYIGNATRMPTYTGSMYIVIPRKHATIQGGSKAALLASMPTKPILVQCGIR
jgi:hypothetical protein